MPPWLLLAALSPLLVFPLGCQRSLANVSGEITWDGKPLAEGFITLIPTDGKGSSLGSPIKDGMFRIAECPPGPRKVLITTPPRVFVENKAGQDPPTVKLLPVQAIAPTAIGNNQVHEITAGNVRLEIHMKAEKNK